MLAENLADLLRKAPVTARWRLAAVLLRLWLIEASALFRCLAHHDSKL
jgi:hypothetical protein